MREQDIRENRWKVHRGSFSASRSTFPGKTRGKLVIAVGSGEILVGSRGASAALFDHRPPGSELNRIRRAGRRRTARMKRRNETREGTPYSVYVPPTEADGAVTGSRGRG